MEKMIEIIREKKDFLEKEGYSDGWKVVRYPSLLYINLVQNDQELKKEIFETTSKEIIKKFEGKSYNDLNYIMLVFIAIKIMTHVYDGWTVEQSWYKNNCYNHDYYAEKDDCKKLVGHDSYGQDLLRLPKIGCSYVTTYGTDYFFTEENLNKEINIFKKWFNALPPYEEPE